MYVHTYTAAMSLKDHAHQSFVGILINYLLYPVTRSLYNYFTLKNIKNNNKNIFTKNNNNKYTLLNINNNIINNTKLFSKKKKNKKKNTEQHFNNTAAK